MRFSALQKYILLQCLNSKSGKILRTHLNQFYNQRQSKPKLITKIITQSLERLINREFLIGHGIRTPHKWFIKEIKLTSKGRKEARKLLGEQMKLPLRSLKH
jgi:hypothetical protein